MLLHCAYIYFSLSVYTHTHTHAYVFDTLLVYKKKVNHAVNTRTARRYLHFIGMSFGT